MTPELPYHYKIVNLKDRSDIPVDSKRGGLKPLPTFGEAHIHAEAAMKAMELPEDQYFAVAIPEIELQEN